MNSKATKHLRESIRAWFAGRIVSTDIVQWTDASGRQHDEEANTYLPESEPTEVTGEALASACEELAAEAARVGLGARPALLFAREMRLNGYRDVEYSQIAEVEILADEVDLRQPKDRQGSLGSGGPAKTLAAVCRAVRAAQAADGKKRSNRIAVTLDDVKRHLAGQDSKKAADYLAPSGKLCKGGWIERASGRVILTSKGKRDGERRTGL